MKSTYNIIGMTCEHCAQAVTEELTKIPEVSTVVVDQAHGTAEIESDSVLDFSLVTQAVEEAGYSVAP